ncbi:glycosyltransferase [Aequorivita antarctica]|nr:glycosyltransferase [Aequorivita antarctica]
MIVKNEAHVIRRCLDSLKGFIDTWVIVDTGSTDGTQKIIKEHLKELPGELIEKPWVNFAHNRSEAIEFAKGKGDFVLIIDADEVLEFDKNFTIPKLTYGSYHFVIESGGCSYFKTQLVDNSLKWSFKNVIHEYIQCEGQVSESVLENVKTLRFPDGARARDPETYKKDAAILEEALKDEPENSRYRFYLAQSYRDAKEFELAIVNYQQRVDAGGWNEEVWYSMYQIAQLKKQLARPWPEVLDAYLKAHQFKPDRAGPLYQIGIYYQARRDFHNAFLFLRQAMEIKYPKNDRLFIEKMLYDYLIPVEFAVCAYYVGRQQEAIQTNNDLLKSKSLPPELIERVISNRRYSLEVLQPKKNIPCKTLPHICVVIPFKNPTPDLDNLVETLLYQKYQNCTFYFIDDGSIDDPTSRIALEDERFRITRRKRTQGWGMCMYDFLNTYDEAVVLPLCDHMWLASPESLTKLAQMFCDYTSEIVYGQYRESSGHLGMAIPFSSQYNDSTELEYEQIFPMAFKKPTTTMFEAFNSYTSLMHQVLTHCPFEDLHFNDEPLVVINTDVQLYFNINKMEHSIAKDTLDQIA